MPEVDTFKSSRVAEMLFAMPSQFCWSGRAEITPFAAFPAHILTCGVGSSWVEVEADRYAAQPFSHATTVLFLVDCVTSFTSDWLFPPEQSRDMVRGMLKNGLDVTYCNINSSYGHDAFLLEDATLGELISNFLKNLGGEK